jgi:hypothetical protein
MGISTSESNQIMASFEYLLVVGRQSHKPEAHPADGGDQKDPDRTLDRHFEVPAMMGCLSFSPVLF